ncbi:chemotaxis protein CheX [Cohnella silvisoli]|uniref:Chemotaxis protein CheX n=1 Tax=Cohnella silvisoli TaxID=2873699 RepID=A0ABV1L2U3_9BACL|nr:chemotaxis protein CheX [Cohnella silvisoli]MCD9025877.1 chemotaxis protein CheX [Cohnella silvisoli]
MKAIYINPFLKAASHVFEQFQLPCKVGSPSLKSSPFSGLEVLTIVGITGDIRGQMYFGGSMPSILEVVSTMMGGVPVEALGSLEQSAFSELANMICGNAMSYFSQDGITLDITPPTLIMGKQIEVSAVKMSVLSIPIILNMNNQLEMNIVFEV